MPAFLRRALALTIKEVQQLRRNRKLTVQLLVPPTLVLIVFGFALNPKVRGLRLGLVDESMTPQSRELVSALTENRAFDITGRYLRTADAEHALRHLDLDLFLVIPADYANRRERRQPTSVQVVTDAVDANTAAIAQGYLQRALGEYSRTLTPLMSAAPATVTARAAVLYNPGLVTPWFFITGTMSVLMLINGSLVASALAVREKEVGTMEQLLMTPAQTAEILVAKTLPVFILLLTGLFLGLGVATFVFGLPFRGSFWLFLASGSFAALAGIGVGVLLATVSQSQQQAQLLTFFINPPLVLLSGANSPIENMPDALQYVAWLDPLRYLVVLIRGVTIKGAPFLALWPNLLILGAFAIVLFSVSAWRFRKQ